MPAQSWFSAKTLYAHHRLSDTPANTVYEERIVVFLPTGAKEALTRAEAEARHYATQTDNIEYLNCIMVYDLTESQIQNATEVFSLMRDTALTSQQFLQRYHDEESERASHT